MSNAAINIDQTAAPVVQGVVKPALDLKRYKEVIEELNSGKFTLDGQINLACWLGERAHFLVDRVETVEKQNSEMMELLRDIYRITGMNSRASHREQTAIFQRMRQAIGVSV